VILAAGVAGLPGARASSRLMCVRLRAGNTLALAKLGPGILFSWGEIGGARRYRVRYDADPAGDFAAVLLESPNGGGVTLAPPPEPLVFFRVTADAGSCEGPR
jgi:hypothetical protein